VSFADDLFEAQAKAQNLEEKFCGIACEILGIDHNDLDSWPFEDYRFDSYDASFGNYIVDYHSGP